MGYAWKGFCYSSAGGAAAVEGVQVSNGSFYRWYSSGDGLLDVDSYPPAGIPVQHNQFVLPACDIPGVIYGPLGLDSADYISLTWGFAGILVMAAMVAMLKRV
jgi:hypothetical protein